MAPTIPKMESPSTPAQPEGYQTVAAQCQRLEKLLIFTLAALIVTIVSVNFFLSREARAARVQCKRTEAALDGVEKIQPLIRNFLSSLQAYAANNQDFRPIWDRYRPALTNYLGPVPTAAKPTPAPRPPAAKPTAAPKK